MADGTARRGAGAGRGDPFGAIAAHLAGLCARGRVLNAGLARRDAAGGEVAEVCGRVAPDGPALDDPGLRLRMASISKAATARAVLAVLAERGDGPGMAAGPLLGLDLPGMTIDHLLSHMSGLTDHAGYVIEPGDEAAAFLAARPLARSDAAPGTFFRYANLNYILLGLALERLTGERFDRLLGRRVLGPAGIGGGFNWAGVPDRRALPIWQRHGDRLVCEADGAVDPAADVIWRGGRGLSLDGYRIGRDAGVFSPHAGLRMSVGEAARLAAMLGGGDPVARAQRRLRWRHDGSNGEDCDGLFTAFGAGVAVYRDHPRIPGHLTGHAGHALGFSGGAWFDHGTGTAWAYFLNGMPDLTEGRDEEAFFDPDEHWVMARLAGGAPG
jgi:CubicO group peptidase (beta-lactamase class C family)